MRRHGRRAPGLRQRVLQVGHASCPGLRSSMSQTASAKIEPVVVAAAERLVEEEVAGLLEAGERADLVDAALHVGMAGLPVVGLGAVLHQHRIGHEQAGRFHVGDERRVRDAAPRCRAPASRRPCRRRSRRPRCRPRRSGRRRRRSRAPTSALCLQHRVAHGVQHLHVFGVGIVVREGVVELAVERHHLAADRFQHLRRERAGGAVAAGARPPSACA